MASLKQWQGAFKSHTKEKTGILRAERLREALYDVGTYHNCCILYLLVIDRLSPLLALGFQVSNEVLSALILRHMRKDGTLRFGDFVSAVVHLAVAFGNIEIAIFANYQVLTRNVIFDSRCF